MATAFARRPRSVPGLYSGPWKGVFSTRDPYDAAADTLVDAKNVYVADPENGSGAYGRPGFRRLFGGTPVYTSTSAFRGQAVYYHTMLDGSVINFLVIGGHIFRVGAGFQTATDVTPVGVAVNGLIQTRVFFASLIGTLMVTDGVNRPWVATDLTSTPITGTYIDYDSNGVSWTIYGAPKVYNGAAFGILNQVNSVSRRQDISWCEPGQLSVGWQQTDFDNNWTLSQNEAGNIFALEADNLALRYFRETSIGAVSGTVGPDLASTATDDAVAFNIGAQASQTIQKFGNGFFFIDQQGRPWFYEPGQAPLAIWKQMRSFIEAGTANSPTTTAIVATGIIEPTLNLYIVGIYSPQPATQAPVVELHVFDAITRKYQGRWTVGDDEPIECVGTLVDGAGRAILIATTAGGYVWAMNALGTEAVDLATQSGVSLATQNGVVLCTEGQAEIWTDDGVGPEQYVQTDRLGFNEDIVLNVDMATVITLNPGPVRVTVETSAVASTVEGYPEPSQSQDGTYRLVTGCDAFGRGPLVTVGPVTYDEQFAIERVTLRAVASNAGPEDA